jgi:hypothetical protein
MGSVNMKQVEVLVLPDGRVDTKNAAAFVGLSEKTLAMMRCSGKGPKYLKRGRIFYFVQDLESWIKDGEALSTSQARVR